jgi:hydrogenase nickel incorporation protein HypA/HybF
MLMHEASMTSSIIGSVLETLREQDIDGTVTSVQVTVGVCQGMVPDSMQMFFDMEKPGTVLEHAELVVTAQGMVARCNDCSREFDLEIPDLFCPRCARPMELLKGNEIIITGIEVEYEHSPE